VKAMTSIEKYVDNIVGELFLPRKEKRELKLQFIDHINSIKDDYIATGVSEYESIKLAINEFGNQEELKELVNNKFSIIPVSKNIINTIFFMFLFLLFGHYLKLDISEYATERIVSIKNFIPFLYITQIINSIIRSGFTVMNTDRIITYLVAFIPVGMLIPLVTNKYSSFKSNFKTYSLFSLGILIIRFIFNIGFVTIDHFILHLSGCIIGYIIYNAFIFKQSLLKIIFRKG
jgi:glycopeptide antibiotics resistance protein